MYQLQSTQEQIPKESWSWEAHYNDGTALRQFDDSDMSFHQFREIDRDKLVLWRLTDGTHNIDFDMNASIKPIHFYKNSGVAPMGGDIFWSRAYVFGYESETSKNMLIVYPNGVVVETTDADVVTNAFMIGA